MNRYDSKLVVWLGMEKKPNTCPNFFPLDFTAHPKNKFYGVSVMVQKLVYLTQCFQG